MDKVDNNGHIPDGLTEDDLRQALSDEDLTDEYEPTPAEALSAAVDGWIGESRVVAGIMTKLRTREMMARGSRRDGADELRQEIRRLTDEALAPAKECLSVHTALVLDLFAEHPETLILGNILTIPANLRRLVRKGLYARGIDVRDMCDSADAIEAEREGRASARQR